jgi:hypothetical protein
MSALQTTSLYLAQSKTLLLSALENLRARATYLASTARTTDAPTASAAVSQFTAQNWALLLVVAAFLLLGSPLAALVFVLAAGSIGSERANAASYQSLPFVALSLGVGPVPALSAVLVAVQINNAGNTGVAFADGLQSLLAISPHPIEKVD